MRDPPSGLFSVPLGFLETVVGSADCLAEVRLKSIASESDEHSMLCHYKGGGASYSARAGGRERAF